MPLEKSIDGIYYYRYDGGQNNNQHGVKPSNSNPNQLVQGKNTEYHYGNGQPHRDSNPFYDVYLPSAKEY